MALGSAIGLSISSGDLFRPASNIGAMTLTNQINALNRELNMHQLRLATGRLQPRMEDGPSFFSLQNKMRNQVRGKAMALDNVGDAKDQLSMAEAGLLQIDKFLGQMRDLVIRGGSDTLTAEQRDDINRELDQLAMAIDVVVNGTKFNEGKLLDGNFKSIYQVGPNEGMMDMIMLGLPSFFAEDLGVTVAENTIDPETGEVDPEGGVNVLNNPQAKISISRIDDAINRVKDQLNELGGFQRKLTALEDLLAFSMAAEESQASRFGDADLAREQTEIQRLQLLQQLATSMLAAANVAPAQFAGGILGG